MKKIIGICCVVVLVFLMASCGKDEKDAAFNLSRINLNGVKYLAFGSKDTGSKDGIQSMLYSIDGDGNMQLVAYEYDCDEQGLVTELSRNIGISINQMIPVGDKYIWLVGCRYVCEDYSGFSESMQDRIKGMVEHSVWSSIGENFLIRKSDGKIFDLNEVVGVFPICAVHVPSLGGVGCVGIGGLDGYPLDGDLTGDRLRKLGLINQLDDDIFLASGTFQGGLHKLHDNGNSLSMINVMPGTASYAVSIAYAVMDNQGHLGTCIGYTGNHPDVAVIMAPDGTLPAIQGIPVAPSDYSNMPEMRCIGGKFFVSAHVNVWDGGEYMGSFDSIYRVDINGSPATATAVAEGYFSDDEYETYSTVIYVSDEENYTWYSGTTLYTFNANTYQFTQNELPEGWPQYSLYDAEGHYYEPHLGNGLQSFTIYNLATLTTEEVSCNRAQVPAFNFLKDCSYDGGLQAFIESVIMADGSTVTIVTPVTGPDCGISHIESSTEPNNNIVISTLIPLN